MVETNTTKKTNTGSPPNHHLLIPILIPLPIARNVRDNSTGVIVIVTGVTRTNLATRIGIGIIPLPLPLLLLLLLLASATL